MIGSEGDVAGRASFTLSTPKSRRFQLERLGDRLSEINKSSSQAAYFLIQLDTANNTMRIVGYQKVGKASEAYGIEENAHSNLNTVIVEVDSLEALREAYPNYFLDVQFFTQNVLNAMEGRPIAHSIMRPSSRKRINPCQWLSA
jgi:GH25 family lysozyme M1 (1,4-beta-N-acetylmuramidase)